MVDATKRQIKVPTRYIPYLEKHRIYDLFHEIACDLVLNQPEDHILHIKQNLRINAMSINKPRILIIAPPYIDKTRIGEMIAKIFDIPLLSCKDMMSSSYTDGIVSQILNKAAPIVHKKFWVLIDGPTTADGAKGLQRGGIFPTHTFLLKPTVAPDVKEHIDPLRTCLKKKTDFDWDIDSNAARGLSELSSPETEKYVYEQCLPKLREIYQPTLREIEMKDKTLEEIAHECANLSMITKNLGAPKLPRILLIGQHGSGRKTQAEMLSKRFNLVHVDMEHLIATTRLQQQNRFKQLLKTFDSMKVRFSPELMLQIIEKRLLMDDCVVRGWVMTGYPRDLHDYKMFETSATPPNRVIFLDIPLTVGMNRLTARRYNAYTGSEHNLTRTPRRPAGKATAHLKMHPNDNPIALQTKMEDCDKCLKGMNEYAGPTASHVDATQHLRNVFECVSAIVMQGVRIAPSQAVPQGDTMSGKPSNGTVQTQQNIINHLDSESIKLTEPNNNCSESTSVLINTVLY